MEMSEFLLWLAFIMDEMEEPENEDEYDDE